MRALDFVSMLCLEQLFWDLAREFQGSTDEQINRIDC